MSWRRTGQRRGRGSASGRQKRLYRPGGRRPLRAFYAKTLADEQVNTEWLRLDPQHRTSTVVVDLDNDGERSFTFMVRPSADLFLDAADLPSFRAGEWLHVCSIALSAEPSRSATFQAMAAIRQAGGFVSFDPNIRADLWHDEVELRQCLERALACADVVKISVEELAFLTGNAQVHEGLAALMRTCPARLVLVTQGKEGVTAWQEGALTHYAASPVECIDTTGAGMLSSQGYCSVWHVMARPVSQRSSR